MDGTAAGGPGFTTGSIRRIYLGPESMVIFDWSKRKYETDNFF
jgi:hypothetical protein